MGELVDYSKFGATRIADALCFLEQRVVALQEQVTPKAITVTPLQRAKDYYCKRRQRDRIFENPHLFADPAWDILIDLFIAFEEGRRISVSSCCIGSGVPITTALRWIKILEEAGHILRQHDPSDARRTFITLTEPCVDMVRAYFSD